MYDLARKRVKEREKERGKEFGCDLFRAKRLAG
jgi:hypothetical protein